MPRPLPPVPRRPRRPAPAAARLALAAALAPLLVAAAASADGDPPSLVLVTLDTLRADHLGCYGYFRDTSPRLDAFAADALLLERAQAPMPTTLPSHVSLLTSTLPARHGVLSNFRYLEIPFASHEGLRSAAQILGAAGYRTAAFTSASPLSRGTGIDVGFEHFDGPPAFADAGRSVRRPAEETVTRALAWLDEASPRGPFLLWVHLFDPHMPYEPPAPYDEAFTTDAVLERLLVERGIPPVLRRHVARNTNLYDGEILYTDAQLGRLLDGLRERGLYDASVVVVAGDHGEGLLQHDEAGHESLYRSTLEVPLVLRWPGGPRGERSRRVASLIDVLPTLAAHTELPLGRGDFDGVDLLGEGEGEGLAQAPVSSATRSQRTWALVTTEWKYWRLNDAPDRLYHLAEDPGETRDVIAAHPEVAERLSRRVDALLERTRSRPGIVVSDDISPELRARLRALGYAE